MSAERYEKLAEALVASPDPVRAIASELGDQHARIDGILERLQSLEFRFAQVRYVGVSGYRGEP